MNDPILDPLNPQQKEAVTYTGKHLLVCAGPGTGKTRVITHRIAYLVRHMGIDPESILAITFTNKAASEMRQRVENLLNPETHLRPWIGTFHALGHWILRRHAKQAKLPENFLIYDRDDQKALMREVLDFLQIATSKASLFLDVISGLKDELMDAKSYSIHADVARDPHRACVAKVYLRYQEMLRRRGALDFGDLLLEAHNLLRDNPEIADIYRKRFQYFFIDEYQDTNRAQYAMTKILAGSGNQFTCVGDEDQLIYRWRGADPRTILQFEQEFKGAGCVLLCQNYRSTPAIVEASKKLIEKNKMRKSKDLRTSRSPGPAIQVIAAQDEKEEARIVAQEVARLIGEGVPPSDIAVFYRINAQSRHFEIDFKMSGIPYRLIGSVGFYARREVKDVLAFARLLVNPKDETSLWRVLTNFQRFCITADAMEKIKRIMLRDGIHSWEAAWRESKENTSGLSKKAQSKLERLFEVYNTLAPKAKAGGDISTLLESIVQETGLLDELEEEEDRLLNIRELIESASSFQKNNGASLADFLHHTSLLASTSTDNESQSKTQTTAAISLMTVHLAKGLEFDSVFVTGMEEGLFPFKVSKADPEELEEERRLCYVAMTRAKNRLYLLHSKKRLLFGGESEGKPSRFLFEAGLIQGQWEQAFPIKRGTRVKHPLFGIGRVLSISGAGQDAKITIHFSEGSTRKFLAGKAPLEVLNG